MAKTANKEQHKNNDTGKISIKVTVQIPDSVRNRREKINRIYDILKPGKNS
jgi:acetolactate synthase regulatory subunit